MDKVSIILPLYNSEKYLKHTLTSIKNQNYKNWELIIVDDASTDNSLSEAQRFAKEDNRIKIIASAENKGVGASRNIALAHATGRYIAFIDSDDLWSKEKLSRQIVFMRKHDAAASHTSFAYINEKGQLRQRGEGHVDEKIDMKQYISTSQICLSSVMIDRSKIPDIHFTEGKKLCEDAILWMHLFREGYNFYGLNQTLVLYRVRPHQLSSRKDKMLINSLSRCFQEKTLTSEEKIICSMRYVKNALKKWCRKPNVNINYIKNNFNCR